MTRPGRALRDRARDATYGLCVCSHDVTSHRERYVPADELGFEMVRVSPIGSFPCHECNTCQDYRAARSPRG